MQKPIMFLHGGQRLYGMFSLPKGEGPFPAVLLCHGFTGTRFEPHRYFVKLCRALEKKGIASLRFDFLGHGDSEGDFYGVTLGRQIQEAGSALKRLRAQKSVDASRCGALGLSMGGAIAASMAGEDGGLRALSLINAVARPALHFKRHRGDEMLRAWRKRGFHDFEGNVLSARYLKDLGKRDPLRLLARHRGALQVIYGEKDRVVSPVESRLFKKHFPGESEIHCVKGADHTMNRADWEAEAIRLSCGWFAAKLAKL